MRHPVIMIVAGLAGALGTAAAQDALTADRPGFSTAPDTVATGVWQLEAGFERAESGAISLPAALLRRGVGPNTEVRFTWNGVSVDDGDTEALGGSVAVKHRLSEGETASTGLLLSVAVDGDGGALDPEAGFLWTKSLGDWSLFGTATAGLPDVDGERRLVGTNAVGISRSFTERAGFFVEHFVSVTEGEGEAVQVIDSGVTYLLTDDIQLDVNGGVSVGGAEADGFVGAGIVHRF